MLTKMILYSYFMLWSVYLDKYTVSVSSVEDTRDTLCTDQGTPDKL